MSPAWKTCSTSMPRRPIRRGRWSASTRARVQLIGEVRQPIPAEPVNSNVTIASTAATASSISSSASTCIALAQGQGHRAAGGRRLRPVHARTRRCPLSRCRLHPGRAGHLSTHSAGALYEAFAPAEARRILRRLEFHYTPKHASWLNMVRDRDRRAPQPVSWIAESTTPSASSAKSPHGRNNETPPAPASNGCSPTDKARAKMGRAYPVTSKESQSLCRGTSMMAAKFFP